MGSQKLDLSDPEVKRKLLEQVLSSIYGEQEIEYLLKVVKSTYNLSEETEQGKSREELLPILEKGLDTLEVLMRKLGFQDHFGHILASYNLQVKHSLQPTLIKVLTRCKIMYLSLYSIQTIFKLITRRDLLQQRLCADEEVLAQYCYQSCRLFIQITSFMVESRLFKSLRFVY